MQRYYKKLRYMNFFVSFLPLSPFCIFAQKRNIMATTINTTFSSIYLTSHLPEEISITTDQASVEVSLFLNSSKVFSSVYYPYEGEVIVRDISSIIESHMSELRYSMTTLRIEAKEPEVKPETVTYDEEGNMHISFDDTTSEPVIESTDDINVVFSRFKSTISTEYFLRTHFLTTRKSALIPRRASMNLSYCADESEEGLNYAIIHYSTPTLPSQILSCSHMFEGSQFESSTIVSNSLSHAYFKSLVDRVMKIDSIVHGVEYHIGSRQFNLFFTDEQPSESFTFLNAFNILETVNLFGTTTIKTEVNHSEAVCGHKTQFYDETISKKYEVETAPLQYDEAKWLSEMLTSRYVTRQIDTFTQAQVLISDITSEVTDSDKDLIRLKFTWKYADGSQWL